MKVAVCGGRNQYISPEREKALRLELLKLGATEVVTGGCVGIDLEAEQIAGETAMKSLGGVNWASLGTGVGGYAVSLATTGQPNQFGTGHGV